MDVKPGAFFLTQIGGPVGFAIGVGQALAGAPSRYSHAGIVLDTDGTVLEAEPGGARIANLSEYAGRPLLVCDGPVQGVLAEYRRHNAEMDATRYERWMREDVVAEARKLGPHGSQPGIPYSPLDYLALALVHLEKLLTGKPRPTWRITRWIRQRVESSGHLICSALVDRAFMNAGIHIFSDGRLPGDVMPSDLAGYAEDWTAANG